MPIVKRMAFMTAVAAIALVAFVSVAQARLAQLDPSFGRGGIDLLGAKRFPSDVTVLRNGSILVVEATATSRERIELTRYHRDGSIDRSFGSHGTVITSIAHSVFPEHMVVAPGGKILVVASAFMGSTTQIVLVRYRRNGSLDNSFGSGGILQAPPNLGREGTSVLVQHDGKIVVGGINNGFLLLRYDANGKSLDPTFDGDGVAGVPGDRGGCGTSSQDGTHDIRIVSGDSIVADGDCGGAGNPMLPLPYAGALRFSVAASGDGGALDTGFGSGGAALVPFSRPNFDVGLAQRSDGGLIQLAQIGYTNANTRVGLAAYTSGGLLDSGFGAGGQVSFGFGRTNSVPVGLRLTSNGKIIAAATDGADIGTFALVRRNSNGSADPKFAPHDRLLIHVGQAGSGVMSSSGARTLTMQTDGKVIEMGTAHVHGQTVAVLVRFGRAPRLSSVHLSHRGFRAKAGTTIRYRDSQAATTRIQIFRHGSLVRGFTHPDRAGSDRVHLDTHGLALGRYRVRLTPVADGITGPAAGAGFRVT